MQAILRPFSAVLLFCALAQPCFAQTYNPKTIRIEGMPPADTADLLRTAALTPGTSLTKEQIEAGLQKLADTGMFNDISYTVDSNALVLKLTPSDSAEALPVRFTNFVWWTPAELNALIQARVPLYQGKLSLKGTMMEQVEAALVDILKQKGIDAEVTPIEGIGGKTLSLAISRPTILLGTIDVQGSIPAVASKLADMKAGFSAQEFDQQVLAKSLPLNVTDLYDNAGYLDATADPATFASPRKDKDSYVIDASTTVHPGDLYRIRQINFSAPPPLSHSDMEHATALKPGDPAGAFTIQHASDALAFAYTKDGFFDAKSTHPYPKDASAHTVDVTFTVTPGEVYHLASVDASALPSDLQALIAHDPKLRPGLVADTAPTTELMQILAQKHLGTSTRVSAKLDHQQHLATVIVIALPSKH
jgi:outer membrane protein assembly factor BamA